MFCLSKTQQVIEDLFRMPVFEKKMRQKTLIPLSSCLFEKIRFAKR